MSTTEDSATIDSSPPPSTWWNGVTLRGISWETYQRFLDGVGDRKVFVTYDHGTMEIQMSPSRRHERPIALLTGLIHAIRMIRGTLFETGGTTTHHRDDLERGLEADNCFWIEHEKELRNVEELDLHTMPPPDLVIEVDVHATSIDRIDLYRTLEVPEIWWESPNGFLMLLLDEAGDYVESEVSRIFPFVSRISIEEALDAMHEVGESEALNQLLIKLQLR